METEIIYEACEPMRRIIRTNLTSDGLMVIHEGLHLVGVDGNRVENVKTQIDLSVSDNYISPHTFEKIKTNPKMGLQYRGISLMLLMESREITFDIKDLDGMDFLIGRKFLLSYCELLYNEIKGIFEFRIK